MKRALILALTLFASTVVAATATVPPPVASTNATDSAKEILERLASAWRGEAEMKLEADLVAGFRISGDGGGEYTVTVSRSGSAVLAEGIGEPAPPILTADIDTLRRIDRGEMSAMTAIARAKMSDRTPLDFILPEGFRWNRQAQGTYLPFVYHFFNRGVPEVTRFGDGASRFVHGGNSAILYYDLGLRTAWYQLRPGMHINADEKQKTNPFKSLFVITRGSVRSKIGGIDKTLSEGEAVVVPAGVPHEFWVDAKGYGEFVLVMFGDGA